MSQQKTDADPDLCQCMLVRADEEIKEDETWLDGDAKREGQDTE